MNFYKITLSYQGTRYCGWQKQPKGLSVQGELEKNLEKILKMPARTIGSGRTDAGVHALAQVVRLETQASIDSDALLKALNSLLPPDIRVKSLEECEESFHPIFSARSKEYWYVFHTNEYASVFESNFVTKVKGSLDWDQMQKAAKLFEGKHDFSRYYCQGTEVSSNVREIYRSELISYKKMSFWDELTLSSDYMVYKVRGSGFLKQMVRLMVGTLWNCGRGKVGLDVIQESLQAQEEGKHLAAVAPAQGLYLADVVY